MFSFPAKSSTTSTGASQEFESTIRTHTRCAARPLASIDSSERRSPPLLLRSEMMTVNTSSPDALCELRAGFSTAITVDQTRMKTIAAGSSAKIQ